MSENKQQPSASGITLTGLLGITFVVLKLCGVINWSWWWVTVPFWGGLAIVLFLLLVAFIVVSIRERNGVPKMTNPPPPPIKTKWQQRVDEMSKQQKFKQN